MHPNNILFLPLNLIATSLILLGIIFVIAEIFVSSFGALAVSGLFALLLGIALFMGFPVVWQLIIAVIILLTLAVLFTIYLAWRAQARPIVSGREELIGATGSVVIDTKGMLFARVLGELWQITADEPLRDGVRIKVIAVEGLTLRVKLIGE